MEVTQDCNDYTFRWSWLVQFVILMRRNTPRTSFVAHWYQRWSFDWFNNQHVPFGGWTSVCNYQKHQGAFGNKRKESFVWDRRSYRPNGRSNHFYNEFYIWIRSRLFPPFSCSPPNFFCFFLCVLSRTCLFLCCLPEMFFFYPCFSIRKHSTADVSLFQRWVFSSIGTPVSPITETRAYPPYTGQTPQGFKMW